MKELRRWMLLGMLLLLPLCSSMASGEITVGPGKDYESFTQAVYETYDSGEDIVVYPGEYDIRQEYFDLFGLEDLSRKPDLGHRFEYGIQLHSRRVLFLPGSYLTCIWYGQDHFAPIFMMYDVELNGLNLYAEGTLYAIHDDVWYYPEPFINQYRYCRVVGRHLWNANCIGGGVSQNARIIIDNCYFDNGVAESLTVRYHNTNLPDARSDIWISNSYFNGYLGLCYYGDSAHMDVYVNGCAMQKLETRFESPEYNQENIDLYAWNNNIVEETPADTPGRDP